MGKILKIAAGGAALAALATPVSAQNAASATASASTTILQPLTISKTADLNFGTIVKPTATGTSTITVSSTGSRTITGSNAVAANTAGVSSAAFLVRGEGGQQFGITVPASFKMTSGTSTLTVTTSNPVGATGVLSGSVGSQGTLALGIGGTLKITKATVSGAYSGTFKVTVVYD